MFVNLDTDDSAYETARKCLPYYYAIAATSPHVQAMAAERLQAGWTPSQLRQTLPRLSDYHMATTDHASHVVNRWTHNAPVDKAPNVMRRKAEAKAERTIERRLKASEREQWASEDGKAALAPSGIIEAGTGRDTPYSVSTSTACGYTRVTVAV